jgi:hypothetical protein
MADDRPSMDIGQVPAAPPETVGMDHDTAVYTLTQRLMQFGASGPVALVWRWVLTGQSPRPVSLLPWIGGAPTEEEIAAEAEAPSGWVGEGAEQVPHAQDELRWFTYDPYGDAADLADYEDQGTVTVTFRDVYELSELPPFKT